LVKSLELIRHGQSTFNATYAETGLDPFEEDARLTELGRRQVSETRATLAERNYDLVITSPLTRAIETTLGLFAGRDTPIIVEALHREKLEHSCDVGRSPAELAREFPELVFDHLDDPWWYLELAEGIGIVAEPQAIFLDRVAGFDAWIRTREEPALAIVGHGTFFRNWSSQSFQNCEVVTLNL
jgi:broad specificity phosphatase PhoE